MQTLKRPIRYSIVAASKEAFFTHGFKKTSMRMISENSGVGLSNIYNYFSSKEELLKEVLDPLLTCIEKNLESHNNEEYINLAVFEDRRYMNVDFLVNLVHGFKDELKLLLFNTYGSSFERYKDEYIDKSTEIGKVYMKKMKKKYPHVQTNISDFFIHISSSWWWTVIEEVITHDELEEEDIEAFIVEYMRFSTAGWKQLMQV